MSFDRIRRLAGRPYPGRIELAALAALYGVYKLVRGFGGEDWAAAARIRPTLSRSSAASISSSSATSRISSAPSPASRRCSASSTSSFISRAPQQS